MANRDDGRVGYKSPPKGSRFKPGVSGNPSGRSKASRDSLNSFEKILSRSVPVTINGIQKRVTLREALELKVVEGAPSLPPLQLLKLMSALESAIAQNRSHEAATQASKMSPLVQHYGDCKEVVDALEHLGLVYYENGFIKIRPNLLVKLFGEESVLKSDVSFMRVLRRYYWPGTRPNRDDGRDVLKRFEANG